MMNFTPWCPATDRLYEAAAEPNQKGLLGIRGLAGVGDENDLSVRVATDAINTFYTPLHHNSVYDASQIRCHETEIYMYIYIYTCASLSGHMTFCPWITALDSVDGMIQR